MKAKHVMVSPVKVGRKNMTIREVARTLTENRISALPIIDDRGEVIGIVSEGDLMRRAEIGTEKRRSWWSSFFASNIQLAEEYTQAHSRLVSDVMTRDVITVDPETPLSRIAELFERHRIKRVPVVQNGGLAGIVTRANLVQAIATIPEERTADLADEAIRALALKVLETEAWTNSNTVNVTVNNGQAYLWGAVSSEAERKAVQVAIKNIAGVKSVVDNLVLQPIQVWN